jgi:hypothetical protein
MRRRALSVTSSSESSSSQDDHPDISLASSIPQVVEAVPVVFGHNPQQHPNILSRPGPMLDALPEESDDVIAPLTHQDFIRKKSIGLNQRRNRNAQIFISPPEIPSSAIFKSSPSPTNSIALTGKSY